VKGAIVGFGEVAERGHWPAYAASRELSIVAVVERTAERRRVAESLSSGVRTYETLDGLAAAESIDFVDICTPPAFHAAPMLAAIERGWHVVCEKPFLLDRAVLDVARDRAERQNVAIVPVHNWKYAPIVRDATERLRLGRIGALTRVDVEVERLRDFTGADPARPNWRRDPAISGGGILMDHGWHAVYLILHWFREQPRRVEATFNRRSHGTVEAEADVRLVFSGGEATIRLTWNGTERRNTIRLMGTAGTVAIADDRLIQRSTDGAEDVRYPQRLSEGSHHADWFAAFSADLAVWFRDPASSRAALAEAAACLDVIQSAYDAEREPVARSRDTPRPVWMEHDV
jgi:predicted dehydrogenase